MKCFFGIGSALLFTQIALADNYLKTNIDNIESKIRNVLQTKKTENEIISVFEKKHNKYVRLISSNPDLERLYLNHQINEQLIQHGSVIIDELKVGKYKCARRFIKNYSKGYNCSKTL